LRENLPAKTEFLLYKTEDGRLTIEIRMQDETVWLTINQISSVFAVDKSGISRHLRSIYETGELQREATVAKYATVQNEGERTVSRNLEYYNLDAIISVGLSDELSGMYKNSPRDIQRAVEILELALDYPIDDAEGWDIESRLADLRA